MIIVINSQEIMACVYAENRQIIGFNLPELVERVLVKNLLIPAVSYSDTSTRLNKERIVIQQIIHTLTPIAKALRQWGEDGYTVEVSYDNDRLMLVRSDLC